MDLGSAVSIMRGAIVETLLISAPILIVSMVSGLVISILQATTSLQEQTLSFVPKLAAILATLFFFGPWIFSHITEYTRRLFELIPEMIR